MNVTLLFAGVACVIAAIVGGGLKAFGIEVPLLQSLKRQIILALFGLVLLSIAYITSKAPLPPRKSFSEKLTIEEGGAAVSHGVTIRVSRRDASGCVRVSATTYGSKGSLDYAVSRTVPQPGVPASPRLPPPAMQGYMEKERHVVGEIPYWEQEKRNVAGEIPLSRTDCDRLSLILQKVDIEKRQVVVILDGRCDE